VRTNASRSCFVKPKGLADVKDGEWVDVNDDGLRVGWEKVVDGKGGEKEGRFEWRWKVDSGAKLTFMRNGRSRLLERLPGWRLFDVGILEYIVICLHVF
jgi:hypothetical protein